MPDDELVTVASAYNVSETMERLLAALTAHNMTVFARIDHAAGAASAGLPLRPTEVVLFGNPKGGTALMQDRQTAASICRSRRWSGRTKPVKRSLATTIRNGSRNAMASAPRSAGPVAAMTKALQEIAAAATK